METIKLETTSSSQQVLTQLRELGFRTDFIFKEGRLRCIQSGVTYISSDLVLVGSFRFEGPSNPDDSEILYAFTATDGTKGVFMGAYGINGDPAVAEFWSQVPDQRDNSEVMHNVPAGHTLIITSA